MPGASSGYKKGSLHFHDVKDHIIAGFVQLRDNHTIDDDNIAVLVRVLAAKLEVGNNIARVDNKQVCTGGYRNQCPSVK